MDYHRTENAPSLSSILATLSAYTPSQQQLPPAPFQAYESQPYQLTPQPPPQPPSAYLTAPIPAHPATANRSPPSPSPQSSQPAKLSAAAIISWPPALRHMLALAQDQEAMHRIRHMIQEQHSHERQWWRGREELIRKQKGRGEARGKLDGVLKGLGGHVAASNSLSDPEADKNELERYDRKVYIACGEMIAATEKALKELGVPFFDIRADLVRRQGELANDRKYDDEAAAANKYDGNIGEEELLGLKTKMVELLEDLCKE